MTIVNYQSTRRTQGLYKLSTDLNESFQFSNKLTINHTSSGDPVVAFSEYAKANPYYEKKPDGRVEKWLEYKEELIESPNPLWNANLNSRALDRSFGVTNNFSAEYNPLTSL